MKLYRLLRQANVERLATFLLALWKLSKHPETPRAAKIVAIVTIAYALSPIDLIPDFIPVLGALDDIVLIPLGITLAMKLTPDELWQARLREAQASADKLPKLTWGAALVVGVWVVVIGLAVWFIVAALQ